MSEPITCNLAENALDYLLLAGEQAKEGSPRMLKHAVATLGDGLELLLKARLEMHDWKQLFRNPAKADRTLFEKGAFFSVTFDEAVSRLGDLCSIALDPVAAILLENIRQLRNRIRHFAVDTDRSTAMSLITKTLSFTVDFVMEHIEPTHGSLLENELRSLRGMLSEFEEFVEARMTEITPSMENQRHCPFLDCPVCLQRTLHADGDGAKCMFCGYQRDGEEAASDWESRFLPFQSPKARYTSPNIQLCPECGAEACIDMNVESDGDIGHFCFQCGESGHYGQCGECGQLCDGERRGGLCDDCWDDMLDRND